ncbi:MAG: DUF2236 domain-containing protein [Deferribacteres bacterium]|nr:DUF2236 domain-containing protein [candidate division KSB1 bacterium]MCB9508543.1 DUF2236 domain-containing protein [Deferribacteres bacterium]
MEHPDSDRIAWRVHREAVLLLAGPRALLMQIAHPAIAAGVHDHSDWQRRPYRRLLRTLWLINQIVLGSDAVSQQAVRRVNRRHGRVRGHYRADDSQPPQPYHANQPELQMWVLATLIDSSIDAYQRWIKPLSESERSSYYAKWREVAARFEIPAEIIPQTYQDFARYFNNMLTGNALCVRADTIDMAGQILRTNLHLQKFVMALAVHTLPELLRDKFHFASETRQQAVWQRYNAKIGSFVRHTPLAFRISPLAIFAKIKSFP